MCTQNICLVWVMWIGLKRCAHGGCRLSCLFPWGITNVRPYGNEIVNTQHSLCTDQWCGLRPPVLGQDRSETNKIGLGLGLAGLVLRCETRSVTLVVIMILKDTATFQVLFIVSLFWSWNITMWRSTVALTYLKVKSAKDLFTSGGLWSWSCK